MSIPIGVIIRNKMNELRVSNVELSKRLGMGRQNIHSILKRKSIQVDLLEKIGNALNYDFFQHYCKLKGDDLQRQLNTETAALKKQLEEAQAEIAVLNRIVETLKGH